MKLLSICLLAIVAIGSQNAHARDTLFVNASIEQEGSGRTWGTAFSSLKNAVAAANFNDEVWITRGTYYVGAEGINLSIPIQIYGGFIGGEFKREERNWLKNATVIQALPDASPMITITAVDSGLVLDGLVLQGARNRAILIDEASPIIQSVRFSDNRAEYGGAVLVLKSSSPRFSYCVFEGNSAVYDGGAIAVSSSKTEPQQITIEQCYFQSNDADGSGGAVSFNKCPGSSSISNSVFTNNTTHAGGGAIHATKTKLDIIHCTLYGNESTVTENKGRSIHIKSPCIANLRNSVLWGRVDDPRSQLTVQEEFGQFVSVVSVGNIIQRDFFRGAWQHDPEFEDPEMPVGPDQVWGTSDDGLRLQRSSPGLDVGTHWPNERSLNSDAKSMPRAVGGGSDIGAYEYQNPDFMNLADLRHRLKKGSVVLLHHHGETENSGSLPGPDEACNGQPNLTPLGRRELVVAGRAILALGQEVSESISSTTCRNWESAETIAGFATRNFAWDSCSMASAATMKIDLTRNVASGLRLIMADAAQIKCNLNRNFSDVRHGDVLVIEPDGEEFKVLSHITVDSWIQLIRSPLPTSVSGSLRPASHLTITPNPASGSVKLSVVEPRHLSVHSVLGQRVWDKEVQGEAIIDLAGWPRGVYYVVDGSNSATKLVIR